MAYLEVLIYCFNWFAPQMAQLLENAILIICLSNFPIIVKWSICRTLKIRPCKLTFITEMFYSVFNTSFFLLYYIKSASFENSNFRITLQLLIKNGRRFFQICLIWFLASIIFKSSIEVINKFESEISSAEHKNVYAYTHFGQMLHYIPTLYVI